MKKFFIFTTLLIGSLCYSEELKMNQELRDGMNYYFEKLIPSYYAGNLDTREEKNNIVRKCHMYIYGSDCFSDLNKNGLLFNFYYLINHDYQSGQGIQLTKIEYEGIIYEYWIINLCDRTLYYDYSYFYLTKTTSLTEPRTILDLSTKYMDSYKINDSKEIDLTVYNNTVLYQAEFWCRLQSFKGTKYENMIVSWKKDTPYLRKMNLFEILYYRLLKKAKR